MLFTTVVVVARPTPSATAGVQALIAGDHGDDAAEDAALEQAVK